MPFRCGSCLWCRDGEAVTTMTDEPISQPASSGAGPELTDDDALERVIRLAFDGDRGRYQQFIQTLREAVPPDVSVILRGSAVTGTRWHSNMPFDADGRGTSDLDLTLIGSDMVRHFDVHYIPGMHSAPLSEAHPDASAVFAPLREALCAIARRPVNLQASSGVLQNVRDILMHQPYVTLIEKDTDDTGPAPE